MLRIYEDLHREAQKDLSPSEGSVTCRKISVWCCRCLAMSPDTSNAVIWQERFSKTPSIILNGQNKFSSKILSPNNVCFQNTVLFGWLHSLPQLQQEKGQLLG